MGNGITGAYNSGDNNNKGGSATFFKSTGAAPVTLRNNLFYNLTTNTGTGNDNNVIMNNVIRDRSDVAGVPSYLLRSNSTSGAANDSTFVYGNEFANFSTAGTYVAGTGGNGWVIRKNAYYQTASRTTALYNVYITTGAGHVVDSNNIGGSAADRSGSSYVTTGSPVYGVYGTFSSSSNTPITITNNNISNIRCNATSSTTSGITVTGNSLATITGNNIGRNINAYDTITTAGSTIYGIQSGAASNIISGNIIGNLKGSQSASSPAVGISITAGTFNINNNIIDSIINFSTGINFAQNTPCGITLQTTALSGVISNNSINRIISGTTATVNATVAGIINMITSASAPVKIIGNKINNMMGNGVGSNYNLATAISEGSPSADSIYNNQINIGSGLANASIRAIYEGSAGSHYYLNNSIVVTGVDTVSGGRFSTVLFRAAASTLVLKDNILSNQRTFTTPVTGVTGSYLIYNNVAANATTWKSDYNAYYCPDTTRAAAWYTGSAAANYSYSGFKTVSLADTNSVFGNIPFVNLAGANLHIDGTNPDAWNVFGRGIALPLINADMDGNTRSSTMGTPTTIGADEIAAPTATPADMLMTPSIPTIGTPTVFTSAGRKIAEINWTGTAPAILSAKYYPGMQPVLSPAPTGPNLNSYFNITAEPDASTYNYTIKSYYTPAEASGVADNLMTGIKSHNGGAYTITDGGNTSAIDANGRYITSNPLTDFSVFTMTSNTTVLPIDLKDISAKNVDAAIRIDWSTASENKTDKFELERSLDAKNFSLLATINAQGKASDYTYWDNKAALGINYYRIKFENAAGAFVYSKVVAAEVKSLNKFSVSVYPNPAQSKVTLQINGTMQTNASVEVADITGKLLQHVAVNGNTIDIDMSSLASGIYFIKYSDDLQSQTLKISKQ